MTSSYYGSVAEGDIYFSTRLRSVKWTSASTADKTAALTMSSEAIDRLNFTGIKADSAQLQQWPRFLDGWPGAATPDDILRAVYENAYAYLDGREAQMEGESIRIAAETTGGIHTQYDTAVVPGNVRAGILSVVAWRYLLPFMYDPRTMRTVRS